MRYVEVSGGKQLAMVSDEDFERVSALKWLLKPSGLYLKNNYAQYLFYEGKIRKGLLLHRFILNPKNGEIIDHIDGNGLNCQRENLRIVTHSQNMCNRRPTKFSSSKYKGVYMCKTRKLWCAQIMINKKQKNLGRFKTEKEAAIKYNELAIKIHGEFAWLNKI